MGQPFPRGDPDMGQTWYLQSDAKHTVFISDIDRPQSVTLLRTGDTIDFDYRKRVLRLVRLPPIKKLLSK